MQALVAGPAVDHGGWDVCGATAITSTAADTGTEQQGGTAGMRGRLFLTATGNSGKAGV